MPNNKQESAVLLRTANFIAHNDFFWPKENFWPMLGDVFVSKEELKKKKWIHLKSNLYNLSVQTWWVTEYLRFLVQSSCAGS